MAKIENTSVYPTVLPAADDLLIGTDVNDNNKTVTFLVSSLTGGAVVNQGLQSVLDTGNVAVQAMSLTGILTVSGAPGVGYINTPQLQAAGNFGTVGQVLTSGGAGGSMTWSTAGAGGGEDIQATLGIGNVTSLSMIMNGAGQSLTLSNTTDFNISGVGSDIIVGAGSNVTLSNTSTLNFGATSTITDYSGLTGTTGQILTINTAGTGIEWGVLPPPSTPSLQTVLTAGLPAPANLATAIGIDFVGASTTTFNATANINSAGTNVFSGNNTFSANGITSSTVGISLTGTLWDGVSAGSAGQILSSTATGVSWVNAASSVPPTLQVVLDNGSTATQSMTINTGPVTLNSSSLILGANTTISANSSVGTVGQFLTATATGAEWSTFSAAFGSLDQVLNIGATSAVSIVMTGSADISAPSMSPTLINASNGVGTAGQVLSSTGSGIQWISNTGIGMTSFNIAGDSGPLQTIGDTDTVSILGGTGLDTTSSAVGVLTVDMANVGTAGTYTSATITTNAQGQVTSATSNTFPSSDTTYDLDSIAAGSDVGIRLIDSNGLIDVVFLDPGTNISISTLNNIITIDSTALSAVNIASPTTTSTGTPLSVFTASGIATLQGKTFAGSNNLGFVPSSLGSSQTNTFLRADGTWSVPVAVGSVASLSLITPGAASIGSALTQNATSGNVVLEPRAYAGTNNIGYVPSGGTAATFLRGDGTWATPGGSGTVTSVGAAAGTGITITMNSGSNPITSAGEFQITNNGVIGLAVLAPTLSVGVPLTVTNTSGGFSLINPLLFAGSNRTGFVPSSIASDQTTTFLRADGIWSAPVGSNTTYDLSSVQNGTGSQIQLIPSSGATDLIQLLAGTNITLTDTGSSITIDAAGSTTWDLNADAGSAQTIANGDSVTIAGGTGIATVVSATDTVTITNTGVTSLTLDPTGTSTGIGDAIELTGSPTGAISIKANQWTGGTTEGILRGDTLGSNIYNYLRADAAWERPPSYSRQNYRYELLGDEYYVNKYNSVGNSAYTRAIAYNIALELPNSPASFTSWPATWTDQKYLTTGFMHQVPDIAEGLNTSTFLINAHIGFTSWNFDLSSEAGAGASFDVIFELWVDDVATGTNDMVRVASYTTNVGAPITALYFNANLTFDSGSALTINGGQSLFLTYRLATTATYPSAIQSEATIDLTLTYSSGSNPI